MSFSPPPIQVSSSPEKEEKKKWKDLKLMKKLERQRAQEEQAKLQREEEAAAQREDQGEQAVVGREENVISVRVVRDQWVPREKLRPREWENLSPNLILS